MFGRMCSVPTCSSRLPDCRAHGGSLPSLLSPTASGFASAHRSRTHFRNLNDRPVIAAIPNGAERRSEANGAVESSEADARCESLVSIFATRVIAPRLTLNSCAKISPRYSACTSIPQQSASHQGLSPDLVKRGLVLHDSMLLPAATGSKDPNRASTL